MLDQRDGGTTGLGDDTGILAGFNLRLLAAWPL
jgi:hypothetical protein